MFLRQHKLSVVMVALADWLPLVLVAQRQVKVVSVVQPSL
jgi:hypothetical protein